MLAAPKEDRSKENMKKLVVLVLIFGLLLLVPSTVQATSGIEVVDWSGDGEWYQDTWHVDLYPGKRASVELKVESSEDVVAYVEYDTPKGLVFCLNPPAFEIKAGETKWVEVVVYAPGDTPPGKYEIDFYFKTIKPKTKTVYVDREVPVYVNREVAWWWMPIGAIGAILAILGAIELVRRVRRW